MVQGGAAIQSFSKSPFQNKKNNSCLNFLNSNAEISTESNSQDGK
jgi:hypothetical protein